MAFGLAKTDKQSKDEKEDLEAAAAEAEGGEAAAADPPATEGRAEETPRAPEFRRAFLDEETPAQSAAPAEPAAPPPEGDTFFVSVARDGGPETHRFDDPNEVQTFIEQLLEDNVPQEDVTAFSARTLTLKIRHRPVVKLFADREE